MVLFLAVALGAVALARRPHVKALQ
jgi:hypothetical protein